MYAAVVYRVIKYEARDIIVPSSSLTIIVNSCPIPSNLLEKKIGENMNMKVSKKDIVLLPLSIDKTSEDRLTLALSGMFHPYKWLCFWFS